MTTNKEERDIAQSEAVLEEEISKIRAVITNLYHTDWEWASYHVEDHEKDAVTAGLEYYLEYLIKLRDRLLDRGEHKR